MAFDATGYVAHHASHYYALRTGRPLRRYAKLSAACEVPSLLYLAGLTGEAPAPERGEFAALLRQTWAQQPFQELLADAGYDGEANHRLAREGYGVRSLIPPTRGRPRRRPPAGRYRRRLARRFPRRAYGQRWLIETAFSQDKRRFGEALSARSVAGRNRQLRLRLLVHNLARLLCAGDSFQLSRFRDFFVQIQPRIMACRRNLPGAPAWGPYNLASPVHWPTFSLQVLDMIAAVTG